MKKCKFHKCKAVCCYNVPLPPYLPERFADKIVNHIKFAVAIKEINPTFGEGVIYFTDEDSSKNRCPFLTKALKCNIYADRPTICRRFGEGEIPSSQCKYLSNV